MKFAPPGSTFVTYFCFARSRADIKDLTDQRVSAMNPKPRSNRVLCCILLFASLAGCVPAHHVQRTQVAEACEVRVCRNFGTGVDRCGCKRYREIETQMQRLMGDIPEPWQ